MIVRSWNLRPRPGRYDDAIGLITEGVKLAERHGAVDTRLTQAKMAGPATGLFVLTCEFESLTAYGEYLDETLMDVEAQAYNHRVREAEAPFVYESTAMLNEIDLRRADARTGRGRVIDARYGMPLPGRWDDMLAFCREAFDICDRHGAVGCRLFELEHAGDHTGMLCAVMEYDSIRDYGVAGDAFATDPDIQEVVARMRADAPFTPVSSGLFTEVALF